MRTLPVIPDFELLRRIGGGSYGEVWLSRSLTGIYRAIKIVDRARFVDARPFQREFEGITRFQRAVGSQARQLALLHVGKDVQQGILYYVMELADDVGSGTAIDPQTYVPLTLKELLARGAPVPPEKCIQIGVELANALVGLHSAGLIHRDVKPSNIVFVSGLAKLADLGLITSFDEPGSSIGTPGYAPTEGNGTESADVFSLGKILYELSTGLPLKNFPRLPLELMSKDKAVPFLDLNEVILRACETLPQRRYDRAQQMLDDLLRLQAGRSIKERNRGKTSFNIVRRLGGFAALLIVALATLLGFRSYLRTKQPSIADASSVPSIKAPAIADPKFLAVLSFANLSVEADSAMFADGIHDEVITALVNSCQTILTN